MSFAETTKVSPEKSRYEIEMTLKRYGAEGFAYATDGTRSMIQFKAHGRLVRFVLCMPDPADVRFTVVVRNKQRRQRTPQQAQLAWEQECRRVWRSLALTVKAKLEAVAARISVFEAEFLANIVLPGDKLVGDVVLPEIARAYATGKAPQLLLGSGG